MFIWVGCFSCDIMPSRCEYCTFSKHSFCSDTEFALSGYRPHSSCVNATENHFQGDLN